ncbi:metacaspase-8-like [Vicia villosa]|uniref:metacaspase-8-like n=1 Tax=Vicia villosa TaxID=3911 RepID=UPI00273C15CF|nr:metacaspase-8-like [Vicia villosa]
MGGKKKALIVGFNYPESKMHIKSPANSATRFTDCLMTYYGFLSDDITLMLDENPRLNCNFPTNHQITPSYFTETMPSTYASAICTKLYQMITDSTDGDTLVFYFCGHGGRTPATDYNNNSGFVEYMCCSDGSIITDSNLRHLTECVSVGCSFTVVADCTASGGLIEGAKEILGHSTETPLTNKTSLTSNIWEPTLGTARRPLGILLSACQNDEEARAAINFNRMESACFYTDALLLVIQETKGNVTNWNLVKTITLMFQNMQWKQIPGLYCDESQMDLKFLGLNGSEQGL